jgi:hypothetical protein
MNREGRPSISTKSIADFIGSAFGRNKYEHFARRFRVSKLGSFVKVVLKALLLGAIA